MQKEPCILNSALNYTVNPKGVEEVLGGLQRAAGAQLKPAEASSASKALIQACIVILKRKVLILCKNTFYLPVIKV